MGQKWARFLKICAQKIGGIFGSFFSICAFLAKNLYIRRENLSVFSKILFLDLKGELFFRTKTGQKWSQKIAQKMIFELPSVFKRVGFLVNAKIIQKWPKWTP